MHPSSPGLLLTCLLACTDKDTLTLPEGGDTAEVETLETTGTSGATTPSTSGGTSGGTTSSGSTSSGSTSGSTSGTTTSAGTDSDGDGWTGTEGDCDDSDPAVNPDAVETCNEIDDDCDGQTDEDVQETYYLDTDNDGYGDPDGLWTACDQPEGTATNDGDCDDHDPAVNPSAEELVNGVDDNCDGDIDENAGTFSAAMSWDGSGVTLTLSGSTSWEFGLSETGAGSVGWFGESCIPGSEPWGYNDYGYDVCHTLPAGGGIVASVYPEIDKVEDGSTLFSQDFELDGVITYVLFDAAADCWVWGHDTSYYDGYGCTEISL